VAIARREMILDQAAPDHASVDLCALLDARFLSAATAATDPPGKPVKRKSVRSTYIGAAARAGHGGAQLIGHFERGKVMPVRAWSRSPISCTLAKRRGSSAKVWR
jgi:hypothetical protein